MAIGTSGNQFKNAGIAGSLMAQLIEAGGDSAGRVVDQDLKPLQLQMTRTGTGTVDTRAFSRLRDPHGMGNVLG